MTREQIEALKAQYQQELTAFLDWANREVAGKQGAIAALERLLAAGDAANEADDVARPNAEERES